MEARTSTQLRRVAGYLHGEGVERIFVTRGDEGVFWSTGRSQGIKKHKRAKHSVRNAGGAGDAFLAGLAYAWLEDMALDASLEFALAAAAITLSHPASSSPALSLTAINRLIET